MFKILLFWVFTLYLVAKPIHASNISLDLVDADDIYLVRVRITGLEKTTCKDKTCYLQAMLTSSIENPRYFGKTLGQLNWFVYQSKPETSFIKDNFPRIESSPEGTWSGIVYVDIDPADSDFKGNGQYYIKMKRYTGESTSPSTDDSNFLPVTYSKLTPTLVATPAVIGITLAPTSVITPTSAQNHVLESLSVIPLSSSSIPIKRTSVSHISIALQDATVSTPSVLGSTTAISSASSKVIDLTYFHPDQQEVDSFLLIYVGAGFSTISSFLLLLRRIKS